MNILSESNNYMIVNEYETVTLIVKQSQKRVVIGDFYGDPDIGIISEDETICAMCGCGVIVYFIKEPFIEWKYHTSNSQWIEWGREIGKEVWIEDMFFIDNNTIEITTEENKKIVLSI